MSGTTRERFIAIANRLFYEQGFHATGLDQIIDEVGVTKTTFYKHFESKDDLMVAAVQRRDEWESQAWARALHQRAGDDPVGQILALLDILDLWFNNPDFRGCMFLNTAIEFPNPHDPVHQAAVAYKRKMRDNFLNMAKAAGAEADDAEIFADCFAALIEGALVMRQTHHRDDAARAIRPAVEKLIEAYLPARQKPTRSASRPGKAARAAQLNVGMTT